MKFLITALATITPFLNASASIDSLSITRYQSGYDGRFVVGETSDKKFKYIIDCGDSDKKVFQLIYMDSTNQGEEKKALLTSSVCKMVASGIFNHELQSVSFEIDNVNAKALSMQIKF